MTAAVAFWIAVAAVIIAMGWFKSRNDAEKHETLRRIVEKTGQIEETQFKALFQEPNPIWQPKPAKPGAAYRTMRILGTLLLCVAVGLCVLFAILVSIDERSGHGSMIGFGVASIVAMVGVGLHIGTRFVPRPLD
jgi:hypothetical protein